MKNPTTMEASWTEVQSRLRDALGTKIFNNWIRPLRLVGVRDGRVTLAAQSSFRKEHVISHYREHVRLMWRQVEPSVTSVEYTIDQTAETATVESIAPPTAIVPMNGARQNGSGGPPRMPAQRAASRGVTATDVLGDTMPDDQYTFENFVVGRQNELACAAAKAVATQPSSLYNPVYLHCPSGLGKTHLLNAIGVAASQANQNLKVAYVPAEKFMYHYVNFAREGEANAFKDRIRSVDMLIMDDLQFICGKEATVRELVSTFNALLAAGKQIIVSADKPAIELPGLDVHVRSRLAGGLTVSIDPPDFDLRLAIVRHKAQAIRKHHPRVEIPEMILEFLARRIDTNLRELEGGLKCVAHNISLSGRAISLDSAQELIRHFFRGHDRRISIEDIQKQVALYYRVSMRDLLSHRRDRIIVRPRQVAMYLCKEMTTRSLPEIGRRFGNRDHTTVLYGVRKISRLVGMDHGLAEEVNLIKSMLEN